MTIYKTSIILPEVKKVIIVIPRGFEIDEEIKLRLIRDEMLRRGAPIDELREILYKLWAPPTGTGKLAGTPPNWTTLRAAQSGVVRTVTNTTELNAAAAIANPGDTIVMSGAGGPWTGDWNLSRSGTLLNKIILVAGTPGSWGSRTIHKTANKINVTGAYWTVGGFKYSWAAVPANTKNVINATGAGTEFTDIEFANTPLGTSSQLEFLSINNAAHNTKLHHCDFNGINGFQVSYNPSAPSTTSPFATGVIIEYNSHTGGNNKWMSLGHLPNPYQNNERLLVTGVIVRYNNVLNSESGQAKTSGNLFYRNYIEGASSSAIGFRGGFDNICEGNYFKSCLWGLRVSDDRTTVVSNVFEACGNAIALNEGSSLNNMTPGHADRVFNSQHLRCENTLIAHNTFVNSTLRDVFLGYQQTGRHGAGHPQPFSPLNTKILNNIMSGNAGIRVFMRNPSSVIATNCTSTSASPLNPPPCSVYSTTDSVYHKYVGTQIKNNAVYVTAAGKIGDDTTDGGTPTGYINWNHATLTSGSIISGNIEVDPALSSVYRIIGAPCQNAGAAFINNGQDTATMLDWDGNARTQGAAPDIGVVEVASSVPPATGTYALFGGGFTTINITTATRYKYSDDTVTNGTALDVPRKQHGAAGNATVGIFAGGHDSAMMSSSTQYTYANDAVIAGTNLSSARREVTGVSTATDGYFGGGFTTVRVSTVDKYTYSSSVVIVGGNLTLARTSTGAAGDSFIGVFGGGFTNAVVATTDRYTYTTDTASAGANLTLARDDLAAAGNVNVGVFGGGIDSAISAVTDKYNYSTTTVMAGTNLATARQELGAAANDTTAYFGAGDVVSHTNVVDKYTFASDAVAAGTVLGTARYRLAAVGGVVVPAPPPAPPPPAIVPAGGLFALFGGGFTTENVANTDRYVYATDVVTPGSALATTRSQLAGVGNALAALFGGGLTSVVVAVVDKYTYTGDVVTAGTTLTTGTRGLAAAGNATGAIFAGGFTTVTVDTVKTYTYATDAVVAGTVLTTGRANPAATGDSSLALIGGGTSVSAVTADVDTYIYSNNTVTPSVTLTSPRHSLAASSNAILGVFGGGLEAALLAVTDRYVYASDEVLSGTSLATAREDLASASNATFGLFSGGFTTVVVATTDKYTFDSNTVSAGTALGTARRELAAAGEVVGVAPAPVTTTFGVFAGGNIGATQTEFTDRYVYANESMITGVALSYGRYGHAAVSNATAGIFSGGAGSSSVITDKYTFAVNAVTPGTALTLPRTDYSAGIGNETVGVFGGGVRGSTNVKLTELYTYTGDLVTAGTELGTARVSLAAAGNSTVGIFGGGDTAAGNATLTNLTDQYIYASNVVSPGTNLYFMRKSLSAQGNATVGAFCGGNTATFCASTERYIFSTNAVAPGMNLTLLRFSAASVGDGQSGIFGGGINVASLLSSTSKYVYTSDVMSVNTALGLIRHSLAGASGVVSGQIILNTQIHTKHRGLCSATHLGLVLVGDYVNGVLYHQDPTYCYDDAGAGNSPILILKRRITPVVYEEGFWLYYDRLTLDMEVGDILDPAQFELTWSDNGGVSLNANATKRNINLLSPNSALCRATFNRLGKARWRAWQVDVSAPIRLVVTGASADITKGKA